MNPEAWQQWLTYALVAAAALFVAHHIFYGRKGC